MSAQFFNFENIYRGLSPNPGKLRIAASGIGWKPVESTSTPATQVVTVSKDEIKRAQWIRVARGFQLRLGLNKDRPDKKLGDRRRESFDGFKPDDHDRLVNLFKQYYDLAIETKDLSLRGWNWGKVDVQSSDLAFMVAGKPAFEVPLAYVTNSSISKTEVVLEFLDPIAHEAKIDGPLGSAKSSSRKALVDQLVELRLYVPGTTGVSQSGHHADEESDAGVDGEGDGEGTSAAQILHDLVKEKAELGQVQGEGVVTFPEVLCTTPRGRYDIDMHSSFLRLRGKTYDYKVLYSSIQRLFLLPKPDDIHYNFVVQLDPPIRQGQTRYPFLVMQFAKDEEIDAELNLDEEALETHFQQKESKIEGQAHEVISIVFKGLSHKKIIFPQSFQSVSGQTAIKCNMKANEGLLYFLEKSILFISRQPILVTHNDLHSAKFARVGGALQSSRTFDLLITKKDQTEIQFSSLSREEHSGIEDYFRGKGKKVENEMLDDVMGGSAVVQALLEDDDDDDDDDGKKQSKGSSKDKRAFDHAGGSKRGAAAAAAADDDDDESEDESFHGSSQSSDVAEEFDSNYKGSDTGEEEEEDDDDEDEEEEEEGPDESPASRKKKGRDSTGTEPPVKKQRK